MGPIRVRQQNYNGGRNALQAVFLFGRYAKFSPLQNMLDADVCLDRRIGLKKF
jgi:hypothetical protein